MEEIKITLIGRVVPKARPRSVKGRTAVYMPKQYTEWRQAATRLLREAWAGLRCQKAEVRIYFLGSHKGDPDNLAGAILDSLVDAGILVNDTIHNIPELTIRHINNSSTEAIVYIRPIQWEKISPTVLKHPTKLLEEFPA